MGRKGSFRFFGGEYLKPQTSEELLEDGRKEETKEHRHEDTGRKPVLRSLVGWGVAALLAAVALYIFNINTRRNEEMERLNENIASLKKCVENFLALPPRTEEAFSSLDLVSAREGELGEWAEQVRMRAGGVETYRARLFGMLAAGMDDEEFERALGGRILRLTEKRMREFSARRIGNILGEERKKELLKEFLSSMRDVEVGRILSERSASITRVLMEKMDEKRWEELFGERALQFFRKRLEGVADNFAAVETVIGAKLLSRISKTYLEGLPVEDMVLLVEDGFERLAKAVAEWRREHSVRVTLKNGEVYEGVLLEQTEEFLLLRTDEGKKSIPSDKVEKVEKMFEKNN